MSLDPKKIEQIFAADSDGYANACLNYMYDSTEIYIMGYKLAADELVNYVLTTTSHQDSLVFPICFLYRQFIELRLKEVIQSGRKLLDEPGTFPQHHDIRKLWQIVIPILKKAFKDETEPFDYSVAEHVVIEFSRLDPGSFAFRYPTDKTGAKSLEGIRHINLRRLAEYVDAFSDSLEAASAGIGMYNDFKQEMLSGH